MESIYGLRFERGTAIVTPKTLSQLVDGEMNEVDGHTAIFYAHTPLSASMASTVEQLILAQSEVSIFSFAKASYMRRLGSILGQSTNLRSILIYGEIGVVDWDIARELIDPILQHNRTSEQLEIYGVPTLSGSVHLHNFIRHTPNLTHVTLMGCRLTSACLDNLSESLMHRQRHTIEDMKLDCNNFGATNGWENFVNALGSSSQLQYLTLTHCDMDDAGATALARLLTMEQPLFESLELGGNWIGDEGLVKLTDALKLNSVLSGLGLGQMQRRMGQTNERGWQALLSVVCSSGTIENVYGSNHTLKEIGAEEAETTEALGASDSNLLHASLQINRKYNQNAAARYKIILRHSRGDLELGDCGLEAALIPVILAFFWCGFEESEDDDVPDRIPYNMAPWEYTPPLSRLGVAELRLDSIYRIIRKRPDLMNQPHLKGGGVSNKRKRCS